MTDYFFSNLPQAYIPFRDISFYDGSDEAKDSSAGAIAACGILQMLSQLNNKANAYKRYKNAVDKIMCSLIENYSAERDKNSNGLLLHATYS